MQNPQGNYECFVTLIQGAMKIFFYDCLNAFYTQPVVTFCTRYVIEYTSNYI